VKRGDVYLAKLDPSSGSEQSGSRQVVIVSRDAINRSSPVVIAVPCTSWTEERRVYPSQVQINEVDGGLKGISIALCEQVRAISKDRLGRRWGALSQVTLAKVDRALLIALDLPGPLAVDRDRDRDRRPWAGTVGRRRPCCLTLSLNLNLSLPSDPVI